MEVVLEFCDLERETFPAFRLRFVSGEVVYRFNSSLALLEDEDEGVLQGHNSRRMHARGRLMACPPKVENLSPDTQHPFATQSSAMEL